MPAQEPCYFVSDFHRYARRSQVERYESELTEKFAQARTFIFGGDIFDFRWSIHGNVEKTMEVGLQWFRELLRSNLDCKVHYLLGNHDCLPEFKERLDSMAAADSRLQIHEYFLRLGDTVFLHGEPGDYLMDQQKLSQRRAKFKRHEKKSAFSNSMYDVAMNLRLHKLVNVFVHPNSKVATRLLHYLGSIEQGSNDGVKQVFFGHTHRAIDGYEHGGVKFFNGGAPMKGLEFSFLTPKLSDE